MTATHRACALTSSHYMEQCGRENDDEYDSGVLFLQQTTCSQPIDLFSKDEDLGPFHSKHFKALKASLFAFFF